jgi:hypothetical protein
LGRSIVIPATFTFSAEIWLWDFESGTAWVFVSLPEDVSSEIRSVARAPKPGFGSIRVDVRIGNSAWKTSIFPDSKVGRYILPLKKSVRRAEGVDVGDMVEVTLSTLD